MKHAIVLFSAVFASAVVINAQQVVTFSTQDGVTTTNYITLESGTMKGAPYSAETVNESTQTLADGNRIVQHTSGRVYRDSEGRVRREEDGPPVGGVGPNRPMIVLRDGNISIVDPVAGVSYTLDLVNHVAWKSAAAVGGVIMQDAARAKVEFMMTQMKQVESNGADAALKIVQPAGAGGGAGGSKQHTEETLPSRQIEGVLAEGHRNTTIIPAGAIGNEQPITIVSEEWKSPDLGVLVLTDHKDPRNGESSYRLVNIVRGDPDPSLFQVPADYTIKEAGIRKLEQK